MDVDFSAQVTILQTSMKHIGVMCMLYVLIKYTKKILKCIHTCIYSKKKKKKNIVICKRDCRKLTRTMSMSNNRIIRSPSHLCNCLKNTEVTNTKLKISNKPHHKLTIQNPEVVNPYSMHMTLCFIDDCNRLR